MRASEADVESLRRAQFDLAPASTRDCIDIFQLYEQFPLAAICWAVCGKDPGFTPLSLLAMMRRFARVDPAELEKIQARAMDPVLLKDTWVRISDEAERKMTTLAYHQPDVPIGVAFVLLPNDGAEGRS